MSKTIGSWTVGDYPVPQINAHMNRTDARTVLFLGDLHLDNPKTDTKAIKRLLNEAVEREAAIVLLGDTFDLMQGKNDRRSSKAALKERFAGRDDYLSAALEYTAEFLEPYAKNIWVVLEGNHETAITKYNEVNVTKLLVHDLRRMGSHAVTPGYQSYAMIGARFRRKDRAQQDAIVPFWVAHGHGGGGPVTKGTIQAQRRAVTYPDARFVVSGHIHTSYFVQHEQHRLTNRGFAYDTRQEHYVVSGWKDEHTPGRGYHVESGRGPVMPSGWWADFYRSAGQKDTGQTHVSDLVTWNFYQAKP